MMLCEISQSEKAKCHMISLKCGIQETKQTNKGKKRGKPKNRLVAIENKQRIDYQRESGWRDG